MESQAPHPSEARQRLCLGLLLALVLGLYAQTVRHEFVAFDDPVYLTENPVVRQGLTREGLRWAFGFHAGNWHPLTWLSHMLDVQCLGMRPGAQHLVNALLHALNAALLWLLVKRLTGAGWAALAVAALFALHPLRVESVAWASERKDVLAGTFWMLCGLAYERWARRGGAPAYAALVTTLGLGLMAKSMLVTLPVILLVLDVWPLGRPGQVPRARLLLEKLPLFALALAAAGATFWIQRAEGAVGGLAALTLPERCANALLSYGVYVRQTFWPLGLACIVPHPVVVTPRAELLGRLYLPALGCALALLATTLLAWRLRRSRPYLLCGWLWYLISALPVIGLIQVGQQAHADRYTYLPTIGLVLALVFGARDGLRARPGRLRPVLAALGLALLACSVLTWRQVATWRDSRTLFEHALAVSEHNYVAATYLGSVERRAGRLERARELLEGALADNKFHVEAMLQLGLTLRDAGDLPGARRLLARALRNDPGNRAARRALDEVEGELEAGRED